MAVSDQESYAKPQVFLTPRQALSSHLRQTDGLTVLATGKNTVCCIFGYRIEIVCHVILLHFKHTMKLSDPLLLADGTLGCRMYPAGKVAMFWHLAIPGFPQCDHTVAKLSAGSLLNDQNIF